MIYIQQGILESVPTHARYLEFSLQAGERPTAPLLKLAAVINGKDTVLGIGQTLISAMGADIPGMKDFPVLTASGISVPSTPAALWCWLRGGDPGELIHRGRMIKKILDPVFTLDQVVDAFMYDTGRDLSGYEDGTENPEGDAAEKAAMAIGDREGMYGSSFAAVQQWVHDLDEFERMSPAERDNTIGRRHSDNSEIEDAPESAHVKRTAQESFQPEAFVLRRSMPWNDSLQAGLMFVAFGHSFAAFEAQLRRMTGHDDGITDALFRFTRPVRGSYYWCPPIKNGRPDLSMLGLHG